MSIRIGLMRHGRTAWNRQGRLQGSTDIPLEEDERARLAGLMLPDQWQGAQVLASPLSRASDTALIVTRIDPRTDPRLMEMSLGDWEGRHGEDLIHDPDSGFSHVEDWGWDYRPPNGETPRQVWDRARSALEELDGDTLIVCHMVVMRVILARAHGWDFDGRAPFRIKRDRIYGVTLSGRALTPDADGPDRLVAR